MDGTTVEVVSVTVMVVAGKVYVPAARSARALDRSSSAPKGGLLTGRRDRVADRRGNHGRGLGHGGGGSRRGRGHGLRRRRDDGAAGGQGRSIGSWLPCIQSQFPGAKADIIKWARKSATYR